MWLTKKLADVLDGVDLSQAQVGNELNLTRAEAELLLAEDWAEPIDDRLDLTAKHLGRQEFGPVSQPKAETADMSRRIRETAERMLDRSPKPPPHRRTEDQIREELHDSRATILPKKSA